MPDGRLKEVNGYCALRAMERDGLLTLPPPVSRGGGRTRPAPFSAACERQARIAGSRADLDPITLRPVIAKDEVALWRERIARWHYLGFRRHVGTQLRYLACDAQGRLLAAMEFSASAWKSPPATASSAGPPSNARPASTCSSTSPPFSSCPGSASNSWPPACSARSSANSPPIGSRDTVTRNTA